MKLRLLCTNSTRFSASLKLLANSLSQRVGYRVFRSTIPKAGRYALMYGQSVDKLTQYRWFQGQGLSALEFTVDLGVAQTWVEEGNIVFGRKYLNSSCGKGIVVIEPDGSSWVQHSPCPVYTKYKKKKREFRVHVFKDQVVAVVEKKRRSGYEGQRDTKIRNLANGYVFCKCDSYPEGLDTLALAASRISQSDFKGVDVGFNERSNDLFVIEVNSAPGVQGSNVEAYVNAILAQGSLA